MQKQSINVNISDLTLEHGPVLHMYCMTREIMYQKTVIVRFTCAVSSIVIMVEGQINDIL
jgi:hypothetical protein